MKAHNGRAHITQADLDRVFRHLSARLDPQGAGGGSGNERTPARGNGAGPGGRQAHPHLRNGYANGASSPIWSTLDPSEGGLRARRTRPSGLSRAYLVARRAMAYLRLRGSQMARMALGRLNAAWESRWLLWWDIALIIVVAIPCLVLGIWKI